jgi:hypothetical protein
MALLHQLDGGGRLGSRALLDLGLGSSVRHLDLELDQELHEPSVT